MRRRGKRGRKEERKKKEKKKEQEERKKETNKQKQTNKQTKRTGKKSRPKQVFLTSEMERNRSLFNSQKKEEEEEENNHDDYNDKEEEEEEGEYRLGVLRDWLVYVTTLKSSVVSHCRTLEKAIVNVSFLVDERLSATLQTLTYYQLPSAEGHNCKCKLLGT